jgi:hypothetical protein
MQDFEKSWELASPRFPGHFREFISLVLDFDIFKMLSIDYSIQQRHLLTLYQQTLTVEQLYN